MQSLQEQMERKCVELEQELERAKACLRTVMDFESERFSRRGLCRDWGWELLQVELIEMRATHAELHAELGAERDRYIALDAELVNARLSNANLVLMPKPFGRVDCPIPISY